MGSIARNGGHLWREVRRRQRPFECCIEQPLRRLTMLVIASTSSLGWLPVPGLQYALADLDLSRCRLRCAVGIGRRPRHLTDSKYATGHINASLIRSLGLARMQLDDAIKRFARRHNFDVQGRNCKTARSIYEA
jgi:hypothetical protein